MSDEMHPGGFATQLRIDIMNNHLEIFLGTNRIVICGVAEVMIAIAKEHNRGHNDNDEGKIRKADHIEVGTLKMAEQNVVGVSFGGVPPTPAPDNFLTNFSKQLLSEVPVDTGRLAGPDDDDPFARFQGPNSR
jgi:hypothetical protein